MAGKKNSIQVTTQERHFKDIFNSSTDITFTGGGDLPYGKLQVTQNGVVVCAAFITLWRPKEQWEVLTLGPTPLWSGGGATGFILLQSFSNGVFRTVAKSNEFTILP